MSDEDVALFRLEGEFIPLGEFSEALRHFFGALDALADDVAGGADVEWTIVSMADHSAEIRARGASPNQPEAASLIVAGLNDAGEQATVGTALAFSPEVSEHIDGMTAVLNGRINAVHVGNIVSPAQITKATDFSEPPTPRPDPFVSFGSIEGAVASLQSPSEERLWFVLTDFTFNRRVRCDISTDQVEVARMFWPHGDVRVQGLISRDPETGSPTHVSDITLIESTKPIDQGEIPHIRPTHDDRPPEEIIREFRDAW